jgi:hypothetical protein
VRVPHGKGSPPGGYRQGKRSRRWCTQCTCDGPQPRFISSRLLLQYHRVRRGFRVTVLASPNGRCRQDD